METILEKFSTSTVLLALILAFLAWGRIEKLIDWVRDSYIERQKKIDEEMLRRHSDLRGEIEDLKKDISPEIQELKNELKRFSSLLASYMENTIRMTGKLEALERRIDDSRS